MTKVQPYWKFGFLSHGLGNKKSKGGNREERCEREKARPNGGEGGRNTAGQGGERRRPVTQCHRQRQR